MGDVETFPEIIGPIIQRAMRHKWELVEERGDGAKFAWDGVCRAQAIVSASRELDGRLWVHLSVSSIRVSAFSGSPKVVLPDWYRLTSARDDFLGPEAKCVLVFAPKSEHVNIEEVHHPWHCPEGDGLPDFTRGSGSL
ncbi:MAG: hypothetical protein QGD90_00985 [Candidatus Hydrogenedentes bacterium]|nr:hypothetical protein [Candidatus Hydrogenedentota bacterium]